MTTGPEGALVIDSVGLRFGGVIALRDVSLTHLPDEILGVIGPNGAGKTSLINCITGIYPPTSGSITRNGARIDRLGPEAIVATPDALPKLRRPDDWMA